jgi:branched-chain amino acid transport system substrate-binding protein
MLVAGMCTLVAGGLVACGGSSSSDSGGTSGGGSGDAKVTEIKIAMLGNLTGSGNYEGTQDCNAQKLAIENVNSAGGIAKGPLKGSKLSVECIDDGLAADKAANIAAKMVADTSVWTMSGFEASGEALAAAQVAARGDMTLIGSNVAADFLSTDVDNVYMVQAELPPAGGSAGDLCNAYYGAKKLATLNVDYSYMPSYMKGLTETAKAQGLELVAGEKYPPTGTSNWSPYLTKINASGAQCLLVGTYPPQTCQIAHQARQQGLDQPVVDFNQAYTSKACRDEAGKDYAGMVFGSIMPKDIPPDSFTGKIMAQYKQSYGDDMSFFAANAYNSVLALVYAVEAGAQDRSQLGDYLAKVDGEGVGYRVRFTDRRIGPRNLTYLEAQADGSLKPIAEYELLPDNTFKRLWVAEKGS